MKRKCRLCLLERKLCKSHIIPEFFYKSTYDEVHRLPEMHLDPDKPNRVVRQIGIRERLLCIECESVLNKSETYVAKVLYGEVEIGIKKGREVIELTGLDYPLFRMFLLSVLWRAGVSTDKFFKEVNLGSIHEEELRKRILTSSPGEPHEYPCVLTFIRPGELPVQTMDGLIMNPVRRRDGAHTLYRFVFGSIIWIYYVSSHSEELRAGSFFLTKEGRLTILIRKFEELPFLTDSATSLWETGKLSNWTRKGNTEDGEE